MKVRYGLGLGLAFVGALALALSGDAWADGMALYKAKCASCHGAEGKGDGAAGKFLKPPPPDFSSADFAAKADAAAIKKVVKEGGKAVGKSPSMPSFGTLSDAEIDDLVKVVLGFAGK